MAAYLWKGENISKARNFWLAGIIVLLPLVLVSCMETKTSEIITSKKAATLKIGDRAPDFALRNQDQIKISLSEFRDKKNVVLVFYPAAFTPVWTGELSLYRRDYERIKETNTEVFGVSVDSWASNAEFRKQLGLPFDLLSDWGRDVSKEYGAFDHIEMVSTRKSFLIDKKGIIRFTQEAELNKPRVHSDMIKAIDDLKE